MKTLNIPLDDEDFKKLNNLKGDKLSWRDFLLLMFTHCSDAKKKGEFDTEK